MKGLEEALKRFLYAVRKTFAACTEKQPPFLVDTYLEKKFLLFVRLFVFHVGW